MLGRSKCGQLLELDKLRRACSVYGQAPLGLRTIPIAAIAGTIGRCCDFDRCFNALRPHLRRAVSAVRRASPDGAVPAIDLFKLGHEYFVSGRSQAHRRRAGRRAGLCRRGRDRGVPLEFPRAVSPRAAFEAEARNSLQIS